MNDTLGSQRWDDSRVYSRIVGGFVPTWGCFCQQIKVCYPGFCFVTFILMLKCYCGKGPRSLTYNQVSGFLSLDFEGQDHRLLCGSGLRDCVSVTEWCRRQCVCVPGEFVLVGDRERTIETGAAVEQDGLMALLYRRECAVYRWSLKLSWLWSRKCLSL